MKPQKIRIRSRILAAFSGVLFFSFLLIGVIFNITITQYIHFNAVTQLDDSFRYMSEAVEHAQHIRSGMGRRDITPDENLMGGAFRIVSHMFASNMFIVDAEYNPVTPEGSPFIAASTSPGMHEILYVVTSQGLSMGDLHNTRLVTPNGIYYVSVHYVPQELDLGDSAHWVVYVDVTGFVALSRGVNVIIIMLVCVMFLVSVVVTYFLSCSITRPIGKLSAFALGIGRGNFTPNNFEFKDIELEDLNTALNKSVKQLAVYDSEQKTFFQNVSHELRTPLMSIKCYAEGINFGIMESGVASQTILDETDRLSELVSDLLYVSKIDNLTAVYTKAQTDLVQIVRGCALRQQPMADRRGVSFTFDIGRDEVLYDCVGELIERAVDNLISNAIRYARSEIVLSCRVQDGCVKLGVADDGDGIEAEVLPHVFERFCKGRQGNHGIGLAIVKAIIEQHKGSTTAENSRTGGAIFTIALPLEKAG